MYKIYIVDIKMHILTKQYVAKEKSCQKQVTLIFFTMFLLLCKLFYNNFTDLTDLKKIYLLFICDVF